MLRQGYGQQQGAVVSTSLHDLRTFLEDRDISSFLAAFERLEERNSVELTTLTQRVLPGVLLELLESNRVKAEDVVRLWRLSRSGRLVLTNCTLLRALNSELDAAWATVYGPEAPKPEKLLTLESQDNSGPALRPLIHPEVSTFERVVVVSTFCIGSFQSSDSIGLKKNLCLSSQEREFLKAVRQFFPSYWAYPNIPLRNFIDTAVPFIQEEEDLRKFCWSAQIDVLLCTEDEDPVAAFELDSMHHDTEEAIARDLLKNKLLGAAGLPLIRIRPRDTRNVRAEDFFDLLCAKEKDLMNIRPRRLRPRRNHDTLVPAGSTVRHSAQ